MNRLKNLTMKCFNRGSETDHKKYEIPICHSCETHLRLFNDDTIIRQIKEYKPSEKYSSYQDEISRRVLLVERDYFKKRIKLFHILGRLEKIK